MAVSDFVFTLTAIPVSLAETASSSWQWSISSTVGLVLCKMKTFLLAVSVTVSIESLVWIALDRFVAVVFPMKVYLISSRFRVLAIASTWIVAVTFCSVHLYTSKLVEENGKIGCMSPTSPLLTIYAYVGVALFYIAPLILITILYCAIAVTLRRQDKALGSAAVQQNNHRKSQAIKMSICVMSAFYILFIPFVVAVFLWDTLVAKSCFFYKMQSWFFTPFTIYISACVNPIIVLHLSKATVVA